MIEGSFDNRNSSFDEEGESQPFQQFEKIKTNLVSHRGISVGKARPPLTERNGIAPWA